MQLFDSSALLVLPTGLEIVSIETVDDLLKVQIACTKEIIWDYF